MTEEAKKEVPTFHYILAKMMAQLLGGIVTCINTKNPDGFYFAHHTGLSTYIKFDDALVFMGSEVLKTHEISFDPRRCLLVERNEFDRGRAISCGMVDLPECEGYPGTEWAENTYTFLRACIVLQRP